MITFAWIVVLAVVGYVSYLVGSTRGYNAGWAANQSLHTRPSTPKVTETATTTPVKKVKVATASKKTAKPTKKASKKSKKR